MKNSFLLIVAFLVGTVALAQDQKQKDTEWEQKFEQLGTMLPTPNVYRTASGAPGHQYWQQKADYKMKIVLDDNNQTITGSESITYHNNSPDDLEYLWVQLDQNMRARDSDSPLIGRNSMRDTLSAFAVFRLTGDNDYDGGFKIKSVKSGGKDMTYIINKTMMRIDLEKPLKSGDNMSFSIDWMYNINNRMTDGGRSGLEYFEEEDNYLYTIAQFFPRMAVYIDNEGWQNKQFLGRGEFALTFGDYEVDLTVPSDFVVGATGMLQNPGEVLTAEQMERFEQAKKSYEKPVIIVTEKEAKKNEKTKAKDTKTWKFKAENVRDYGFCASRKFIWDAMAVKLSDGNEPLAMSYYPKEGNPLWEEFSTLAVKQTLETYSKFTIEYTYPVAISVHTASIGMEYPMICFNYGRPNEDGSYSDRLKHGMISVIIHEVGHNFFPMIINSDERQWTWMDEGLNTFVQYLTEQEFDDNYLDYEYPSRRGPADKIIPYMSGERGLVRPIMTNSEQIRQFGSNAYAKPATALNLLRTTVMGPELFDKAFKTYAERWAFKHPTPADLFRTMEDASAVDLDWFWRGWFYGTDYVDVSLDNVRWFQMQSEENGLETRNIKGAGQGIDGNNDGNKDFGSDPQPFVFQEWTGGSGEYRQSMDQDKIKQSAEGKNFYELTLKNKGGLVTPILIQWTYVDGSVELQKIPAEIWKINEKEVTKVFMKDKQVAKIVIDPDQMTADAYTDNNVFPRTEEGDRFEQFKEGKD
ncbi:M1 family metallopeptidase [Ekhidna sp. To15]|uniref:M1 family metallopeptidase n=1 Tax=Ekhidna sp. To15 TaxID=3395267 RepID=UPI003F52410D